MAQLSRTGHTSAAERQAQSFGADSAHRGRQAGSIWTVGERAYSARALTRGRFQPAAELALKPDDVVLTPEGEALQRQRKENRFLDAQCLPPQLATRELLPFKILPFRGMVAILYEMHTSYRQIFTDGRELPKDPNPTWSGYSVGKWDGDTLVVDTTGFNDADSILPGRRPHGDALHIIERFWRRDFGHLEIQFTIDDPRVYAKPWSFKGDAHLIPDTELLEYICNENEKDLKAHGGRAMIRHLILISAL